MKSPTFIFLVATCAASTVSSQPTSTEEGWGKVTWGMSIAQVRKAYPTAVKVPDSSLYATPTQAAGRDASVVLDFVDAPPLGSLAAATVVFSSKFTNPNQYIEEFRDLRKLLVEKYGAPLMENDDWSNDFFRKNEQHHGTALLMGHVSFGAGWQTKMSRITLLCLGGEMAAKVSIRYEDLYQVDALQRQSTKRKLKDL